MKLEKGITLVELLVVVVIIAIISAIAFPAYESQMQKVRRSEARAGLSSAALAQERYFTVNGTYASNFSLLDLNDSDFKTIGNSALITESGYYNISVTANSTTATFSLNAVAEGAQSSDTKCSWMAIDQLGNKTANNSVCW
jgi:type IV pilus assembly protein PilE